MKKSKWQLASALVRLIFGVWAIVSFVILAVNGENMLKWIPALILSVYYSIAGTVDLIDYFKPFPDVKEEESK